MIRPASPKPSGENSREIECHEAQRPTKVRSRHEWSASKCGEDPPLEETVATVVAERQASAGARDGAEGKRAISLRALRCMR